MATLLIVEDDKQTNEAICEYLKSAGHKLIPAYDGASAFTIIDLDGNGENEIVLWIQVNERSDYCFEILYFQDQEVYGFTLPYRAFLELKTDGTFYSSGGMDNRGIRRLRLSERGYTIEEVSDSESQEEKPMLSGMI